MSAQLDTLKRYQAWRRGEENVPDGMVNALSEALDYAIEIVSAAENLVTIKGRFHSEKAYCRLESAVKNQSTIKEK